MNDFLDHSPDRDFSHEADSQYIYGMDDFVEWSGLEYLNEIEDLDAFIEAEEAAWLSSDPEPVSLEGESPDRACRAERLEKYSKPEPVKIIRPEFVEECSVILQNTFPHGMHRGSVIDRNRFCRKYEELTGNRPSDDDIDVLWEACVSIGIVIQDKVFPLSEETKLFVRSIIDRLVSSGVRQGYFSVVFENNQQALSDYGIGSTDVFAGVIQKLYPEFVCNSSYFCTDRAVSTEGEIVRVLNEMGSLTSDEIQMLLPGIPKDRIIQVCRSSNQIVKDEDRFLPLEQLQFDERDVELSSTNIKKHIKEREYAFLREIEIGNSMLLNCGISESALQHALFQKYLSLEYDVNRGLISAKGNSLSVSKVLSAFCEEQISFTLTEINSLATELNGRESNQGIVIAQRVAIQIDSERFVQRSQLDFDIDGIDNALSEIVTSELFPIQHITSFISFPAVSGYSWTYQLLASYCRMVSERFTILEPPASNMCNGLIARKDAGFEGYYPAVAKMALKDNVLPNYEAVGNYAIQTGLLSRRRSSALETIISEMKKLIGES